jgi:ADP-heptose:LPS heptosyltransferase
MLADVPNVSKVKFFRTREEEKWCKDQLQKHRVDGPVVLWALAGSSVHKTWPYLDSALATILLAFPTAQIVLVGNADCEMLEAGWENEPRVWKTSGKWTMRQACAFLDEVDVIIGPETGVVNAAADMDNQKIVLLSHSSHENLTRDWKNTAALFAENTRCRGRGDNAAPACHVLHYGWDHCSRDEMTGTAKCQAELTMDIVWPAIEAALLKVKK